MATQSAITCTVITPEKQVLEAKATQVIVPAHDGLIGILDHRAPLVCELGEGDLRIDLAEGGEKHVAVSGGFAQVLNNQVTVLTEKATIAS
ncbi:MAG: ATP synthase F1 subunit epsilon [Phycisphaerales bacterium]|nr:ATP synthase F1 subunit epsilon [Phycisphaerales bacterium]MCB9862220.1 ATP synthase F1 subunit epsilon [Phycisphaerales bacterium]